MFPAIPTFWVPGSCPSGWTWVAMLPTSRSKRQLPQAWWKSQQDHFLCGFWWKQLSRDWPCQRTGGDLLPRPLPEADHLHPQPPISASLKLTEQFWWSHWAPTSGFDLEEKWLITRTFLNCQLKVSKYIFIQKTEKPRQKSVLGRHFCQSLNSLMAQLYIVILTCLSWYSIWIAISNSYHF